MVRHVTQPCPCMTTSIIIKITRVISMWTPRWITVSCQGVEGPMTTEYYCAIFPFCGGGKKNKGILWLGYHSYPSNYGRHLWFYWQRKVGERKKFILEGRSTVIKNKEWGGGWGSEESPFPCPPTSTIHSTCSSNMASRIKDHEHITLARTYKTPALQADLRRASAFSAPSWIIYLVLLTSHSDALMAIAPPEASSLTGRILKAV